MGIKARKRQCLERDIRAADELEGDLVVSRRGAALGTIEDIMIDVGRGVVAYAIMSCEGSKAHGERLFAIPWESLARDSEAGCFVLDAGQERYLRPEAG